jgi:hypothetical protein
MILSPFYLIVIASRVVCGGAIPLILEKAASLPQIPPLNGGGAPGENARTDVLLAARYRRHDRQYVGVSHWRIHVFQVTHVFVIQVHIHE